MLTRAQKFFDLIYNFQQDKDSGKIDYLKFMRKFGKEMMTGAGKLTLEDYPELLNLLTDKINLPRL